VYFERARIAELLGRDAEARAFYQQFLRRFDMPVPAHRHMRERATEAAERG
jgi:hypothetical protein